MKRESNVLYILRLTLTLLLITGLVAAALAGVNAITADTIAANQRQKIELAMAQVLPGATGLTQVEFTDETGTVQTVYVSGEASPVAGYVVQVAPGGFGGTITMMVGIDDSGITGVRIVSHTETAGLGSVAAEDTAKGEAFRSQFTGLSGTLAVDKDGGTVDAITSATVTSRAVTAGVNAALAAVENLG